MSTPKTILVTGDVVRDIYVYKGDRIHALPIPELDPKVKDWQNNPAYQQEDGQFGH